MEHELDDTVDSLDTWMSPEEIEELKAMQMTRRQFSILLRGAIRATGRDDDQDYMEMSGLDDLKDTTEDLAILLGWLVDSGILGLLKILVPEITYGEIAKVGDQIPYASQLIKANEREDSISFPHRFYRKLWQAKEVRRIKQEVDTLTWINMGEHRAIGANERKAALEAIQTLKEAYQTEIAERPGDEKLKFALKILEDLRQTAENSLL